MISFSLCIKALVQRRAALLVALLFVSSLVALTPQASTAQTSQRCFPQTGFCISGSIRAYWEHNGGLPVFGYPITDVRVETPEESWTGPVQWFERDRLEDHGATGVLAGRLGARYLELTNSPWQYFPQSSATTSCQFFAQTGHSLCEPYASYWQHNGGLERFGYPITPPFFETVEGKKFEVQYFERRRMEWHTELPGSPILLGLLGRDVHALPEPLSSYPACLADALPSLRNVQIGKPLGCPVYAPLPNVPASTQQFERGSMIWTDTSHVQAGPLAKPNVPGVFALLPPGPVLQTFDDTWTAGQDPDMPALTPPHANLYAPWRGFGKVWAEHLGLREQIGWATEPQAQGHTADIELFTNVLLVRINETGVVYAFGNTNTTTAAQIITP